MATEVLFITGIASSTGWTGTDTDIDEGISAADGAEVSSDSDGESDSVLFDLANSALSDADTITRVDIEMRARVTTDGGDETLRMFLFIGGVQQGIGVDSGLLTASHSNTGKVNIDPAWNTDWTAAQLDGMQIQCEGVQSGMPTANTWHIDCGEVTITYTPGGAATVDPADLSHAHTHDAAALTQHHQLAPAELDHAHTIDATSVSSGETVDPVDLNHAHTHDPSAVTEIKNLAPVDLDHAHTHDAAALTQHHQLAAAELDHAHTIDATSVSSAEDVFPEDLDHAHAIDAAALTQHHQLTAADLDHVHTIDATALTQHHQLTAADLAHAQTIDATVLIQHSQLTAADLIHLHTLAATSVAEGSPPPVAITVDGVLTIVRGIEALTEIQQIITDEVKLS